MKFGHQVNGRVLGVFAGIALAVGALGGCSEERAPTLAISEAGLSCTAGNCTKSCVTKDLSATAPNWLADARYQVGDIVTFEGSLFVAKSTFTAQANDEPATTPTLWRETIVCETGEWTAGARYQLGYRVTFEGSTYEARRTHTSQETHTPSVEPALWSAIGSCEQSTGDDQVVVTTVSAVDNVDGLLVTSVLVESLDTESGVREITRTIRAADYVVLEQQVRRDSAGLIRVTIDYGFGIDGIEHVEATTDGDVVQMAVDGRLVDPFPLSIDPEITFVDGQPPPTVDVVPRIGRAIQAIVEQTGAAAAACQGDDGIQAVALASSPFGGEPGHTSSEDDFGQCDGCLFQAGITYVTCMGAAGAVCGAAVGWWNPFAGVACDLWLSNWCLTIEDDLVDDCKSPGGRCCPVGCGNYCCDTSESCLNASTGLCCSDGTQPCPGVSESCTDPDAEVCMSDGHSCPFANVCGEGCCEASDCVNGACCARGRGCVDVCCDFGDVCVAGGCCSFPCGSECCGQDQFCNADEHCETPVCDASTPGVCLQSDEAHCCTSEETCCGDGCCPPELPGLGGPIICCGEMCCYGSCVLVPYPVGFPAEIIMKEECAGFTGAPRVP